MSKIILMKGLFYVYYVIVNAESSVFNEKVFRFISMVHMEQGNNRTTLLFCWTTSL